MCQAQKMPLDLAHHTELSKQVDKYLDKYFYYINAFMKYQDGELSCKIMISSPVKRSLLWLHNKLHLSQKWFGISLVFIQ